MARLLDRMARRFNPSDAMMRGEDVLPPIVLYSFGSEATAQEWRTATDKPSGGK